MTEEKTDPRVIEEVLSTKDNITYRVFFSSRKPTRRDGNIGDFWLQSNSFELAWQHRKQHRGGVHANMDGYDGIFWVKSWGGWDQVERKKNCLASNIKHPEHLTYVLSFSRMSWRRQEVVESALRQKKRPRDMSGSEDIRPMKVRVRGEEFERISETTDASVSQTRSTLSSSISGSPQGTRQIDNVWLLDLLQEWTTAPLANVAKSQRIGKDILQALLQHPQPVPRYPVPGSSVIRGLQELQYTKAKPSSRHVLDEYMKDIASANGLDSTKQCSRVFTSGPTQGIAEDVSPSASLHSFVFAGEPESREEEPVSAISIPDVGLNETCGLSIPPHVQRKPGKVVHWHGAGKTPWRYGIFARGAILFPHVLAWTGSSYISHFSGKQLWLFWPPTRGNLEVFTEKWFTEGNSGLLNPTEAILKLSGLEVLLVDDTTQLSWVVPPGTICCAMTFSKLATQGGFCFFSREDWEGARQASSLVLDIIRDAKAGVTEDARGALIQIQVAIAKWEELVDGELSGPGIVPSALRVLIKGWISLLKERMESMRDVGT